MSAIFLLPAFGDPQVPSWERLAIAALLAAAAVAPRAAGLVLIAALPIAPLAPPLSSSSFRLTEALVVAAIAGWSARAAVKGGPLRMPAAFVWPALLTAAVLLGSVLVVTASSSAASPQQLHDAIGSTLRGDYFLDRGALVPAAVGLMLLEALALFVAGAAMAVEAPGFVASFARMLVAGAAAAALLNIQRFVQIVLRSEARLAAIRSTLRHVRINVTYGDVNAAGSFFALAGAVAARLSFTTSAAGLAAGLAAAAAILAAVWLTGSRAAVAAFLLVAAASLLTLRPSRHRRAAIGIGLALCAAVAIAFVVAFPNRVGRSATSLGWLTRVEMAKVSLRMTADHPWFGVGVGRFYDASAGYMPATRLAEIYPQENAHNNYLQVLAELGILGALPVLWLGITSGRYALRGALGNGPARPALLGGIGAFAATMLLGHPLLTPEVCYVFAFATGVATGAGLTRGLSPRWLPWATMAAMLALAATVPLRVHQARASANLNQVAWGTGPWISTDDGVKARALAGRATLFVPAAARVVEIPVRLERPGPPLTLSVQYRENFADDLTVTATSWTRYRLILGGARHEARYDPVVLTPKSGEPGNVLIGRIVEY